MTAPETRPFSPPAVLVKTMRTSSTSAARLKTFGTGDRPGQLEHVRHGPERTAFRSGNCISEAVREKWKVTTKGLKVENADATQTVDITVKELQEPEALRGMVMIVFTDVPLPKKKTRIRSQPGEADNTRNAVLQQELQSYIVKIHTTRDQMQTSQGELRFINKDMNTLLKEMQYLNDLHEEIARLKLQVEGGDLP